MNNAAVAYTAYGLKENKLHAHFELDRQGQRQPYRTGRQSPCPQSTASTLRRNALQTLADQERKAGAPYLRPLILIQSEPRRKGIETLDFDKVRQELITNHGIPPEKIVVATGDEKGLDQIDSDYKEGVADPQCPVRFIITQKALAEGWDCPFAYILVSPAGSSGGGRRFRAP